jgi:pyridinium-3,5-bisthiocarboxylic acid mononucleotide nickel chelatase
MKTAYFDCYNGISGDMTLGALVDLGLPLEELREALGSLPIAGYTITDERVKRCGVGATMVTVRCDEQPRHRHFPHIREIIGGGAFSPAVKERAIEAFFRIAEAEAAIHETTVDRIHFHEVGAVDAIVDIVGAMWGIEALGITRVLASAVAVGSGTVKCAHGEMPVPAPATARLLAGKPITTGPMACELCTPTGAAILTTLTDSFGPLKDFRVEKVGYGAGSRVVEGHTNYLRVLLGETQDASKAGIVLPVETRELALVTTDIDDMPAEIFGHVLSRLFEAGCLDAHITAVQMKKDRPGASIQVLAEPGKVDAVVELLLRETTTFGVRVVPCTRHSLHRRIETVQTQYGEVRVKLGLWGDEAIKASPEFEDCRRLAEEKGVPLAQVYAAAVRQAPNLIGR